MIFTILNGKKISVVFHDTCKLCEIELSMSMVKLHWDTAAAACACMSRSYFEDYPGDSYVCTFAVGVGWL